MYLERSGEFKLLPVKVESWFWMLRSTSTEKDRDRGCELSYSLWEISVECEILLPQSWKQNCIYWEQLGQYYTGEFWMAKLPSCFRWVSRRSKILSLQNISKARGIFLIKFLNSLLKADVLLRICHNQNGELSNNVIPLAPISLSDLPLQ